MVKIRTLSRFCLAMCLGTMATLATLPAIAAQDEDKEAKEMLTWLRGLRHTGPFPSTTGFSATQPVSEFRAPEGGHEHTQAYKNSAGCVVFFLPTDAEIFGVALKVGKEFKCNGKPIEGKGEIQILRKIKKTTGDITVVGILRGTFAKGMLTGEGEKGNFSFDALGKPVDDTYIFAGNFENSVLNGKGTRNWTGPKTAEPTAMTLEGKFKDGVLGGGAYQGRLNPLPGVEADYMPLYFSERGLSYVEQGQLHGGKMLTGHMFFYNDPARWKVEFIRWKNAFPEAAAFTRTHEDAGGFYAVCEKWDIVQGKLTCEDGNVGGGFNGQYFGVERAAFSIPLPFTANGKAPFNVNAGQRVTIGLEMDKRPGVSCNQGLTRCSGKLITSVLATPFYWYGDAEVRDGSVYPKSAKLYERGSGEAYSVEYKYETDRVMASCSSFKSPLVCAKGAIFYKNGITATGEWRFEGVNYEQVSERGHHGYVAKKAFKLVSNGDTRMEYDDGSWADVVMDDGAPESVDDCGSSDGSKVSCSVRNGTVHFSYERTRSSGPSTERVIPVEPFRMPPIVIPQYKPIVVPVRPTYILPGMR